MIIKILAHFIANIVKSQNSSQKNILDISNILPA